MKTFVNLSIKISIILLIIFTTSCTQNPNTIKVIPKDAGLVNVINTQSLVEKGDLFNLKNLGIINQFTTDQNLKKPEVKFADKILQNPLLSGIDYTKDCFSFITKGEGEGIFSCFSAAITEVKMFENFIQDFKQIAKLKSEIIKNGDLSFFEVDKKTICAWDTEKILILNVSNYSKEESELKTKCKQFFNLDQDNQLVQNKSFQTFYNNKKDISVWFSSELMKEESEFKKIEEEYDLDISGNYLSFFLDFKNGEIELTANADLNDDLESMYSKNKALGDDFNTELLANLTKESLALVCLSIDTKVLYESIKDQQYVSMAEKMSKVTPKEFLEGIGGSFALSVSNLKIQNNRDKFRPLAAFTFDLKKEELMERVISMFPKTTLIEDQGFYRLDKAGFISENIYLGYNSNACLITNDLGLMENFRDDQISSNILDNISIANKIDDNGLYVHLPLELNKFSKDATKEFEKGFTRDEIDIIYALNKIVKAMDFKLSNQGKASLTLTLKEERENSLITIINTIDEGYKMFEEKNNI